MHVSPISHGIAASALSYYLSTPLAAAHQDYPGGINLRRPRHPEGCCTEGTDPLSHDLNMMSLLSVAQPSSGTRHRRQAMHCPPILPSLLCTVNKFVARQPRRRIMYFPAILPSSLYKQGCTRQPHGTAQKATVPPSYHQAVVISLSLPQQHDNHNRGMHI